MFEKKECLKYVCPVGHTTMIPLGGVPPTQESLDALDAMLKRRPVQTVELQLFNRMRAIPLIELALSTSVSAYARIRDSNQLIAWALSAAEYSLNEASRQAAPYARMFETPISYVDQKLCQGLDIVEEKVPIIKQPPALIIEDAYTVAVSKVAPAVKSISDVTDFLRSQASTVKNISWSKANEVLDSYYGSKALAGVHSTINLIDYLIDKYLPPIDEEEQESSSDVVPEEEDKLMHILRTIGRLPMKTARRVYSRICRQLPMLSPDVFKSYMNSLLEFLRLANYISHSSAKKNGKPREEDGSSPKGSRVSFEPGCKPATN